MRFYLLLALLISTALSEAKTHKFSPAFEAKVRSLFFDGDTLSKSKVNGYIARLQQKRKEVVGLDENDNVLFQSILVRKTDDGKNLEANKLLAKLKKHEVNFAFETAIKSLETALAEPSFSRQLDLFYTALDFEQAIKIEGALLLTDLLPKLFEAISVDWKVKKNVRPEDEASNLFDPATNGYLSGQRIAALKAKGVDLSEYNPIQSSFWQKPNQISRIDVNKAALGQYSRLYEGIEASFPADNVFYLDEIKYSDTKPKLEVYAVGPNGKKNKFKLKFAGEIHADPTVSALMLTLGYPTDITRYAKNIKVNIGKQSLSEFIKNWEVYYKRDALRDPIHIEKLILTSGTNEDGGNFIIFKDGSIEAQFKKIERLGPWSFSANSHDSFREVRGLMLLQMWVDNNDAPDFLNNRILLRDDGDSYTPFHVISDPGKALGWIFGSKPELFSWKMVKSNTKDHLAFSFLALKNGVKNKMTYSDGKWMARQIAQLTPGQIQQAVQIGGWPDCVGESYVARLISRRNDLVKNFDLVGEVLPNGSKIELLPVGPQEINESSEKSCLAAKENLSDYTTNYNVNLGYFLKPLGRAAQNLILDSARSAMNSVDRIVIKSDRLSGDLSPVVEIIFDPAREIERNLKPKSHDEQFIVKESLRIGFRFGASFGAFVSRTATIALSLAYPVRSMDEARLQRGFVVNALLPLDIIKGNLPEKFVLQVEHSIENSAGINIDEKVSGAPVAVRWGGGEVLLQRAIFDARDAERSVFYQEQSQFDRKSIEALLGLSIARIPIFQFFKDSNGRAQGSGIYLNAAEFQSQFPKILEAMLNADSRQLNFKMTDLNLKNNFSSSHKKWNLIFIQSQHDKRLDHITFEHDSLVSSRVQYREQKERAWSFLSNGESRRVNVEVYADSARTDDYQINFSVIGLDKKTKDQELSRDFIGFINGLKLTPGRLMNFTPELNYTTNGLWGSLLMTSTNYYYSGAVKKIMALTDNQYWQAYRESQNISAESFLDLRRRYNRYVNLKKNNSGIDNKVLLEFAKIDLKDVLQFQHSIEFLKELKKAQNEIQINRKVKKIATALRKTIFVTRNGFYNSFILGVLNFVVGESHFYSHNIISSLPHKEVNMIEEVPLEAEMGVEQKSNLKYLVFSPLTPVDLYTMFDSWF